MLPPFMVTVPVVERGVNEVKHENAGREGPCLLDGGSWTNSGEDGRSVPA